MNQIELHQPQQAEAAANQPDFSSTLESIRQETSIGKFFQRVGELSRKVYFTSTTPDFVAFRKEIEAGVEPEKIEKAVLRQDFQGSDPATPQYDRLLAAVSLREQIGRSLIKKVVEGENKLGLSETEKVVLSASCDMANWFDVFYWMWRKDMTTNPVEQKIQGMKEAEAGGFIKDHLQKQGVTMDKDSYLYTVFLPLDEDSYALPYIALYHQPIGEISRIINEMNKKLASIGDTEASRLIDYFASLEEALISSDIQAHERLWQEVDEKWMQIKGRMQPIHMIESYVDPLGLRVEPDFALAFRDDRFAEVNERIGKTKSGLMGYMEAHFPERASLHPSLSLIQISTADTYSFLFAGRRLDHRPLAQNLPNREAVRLKQGAKIFIDMQRMEEAWQIQRQTLVKVFRENGVRFAYDNPSEIVNIAASVRVAGHELAHNAFIQPGTRKGLGAEIFQQLEEHKSDLSLIAAASEMLSLADQRTLLKSLSATALRALSMRKDKANQPYLNSALFNLYLMEKYGIISHENGTWATDFVEPGKINDFFNHAKSVYYYLVDIYDTMNPQNAQDYEKIFFAKVPMIKELETILENGTGYPTTLPSLTASPPGVVS